MLSAIIFNCVLEIVFENWKVQLTNEGLYVASDHERMTNTRYVDDILLYAKSLYGLCRMFELLINGLKKVGLHVNADKSKILHSSSEDKDADKDYVEIGREFVRILHGHDPHRYFGRELCLSAEARTNIEFENRRKQPWASF